MDDLIRQSLDLDVLFMREAPLSACEKMQFLVEKYRLLTRHARRPFILGRDSATFLGRDIQYDSRYGLAGLQRALSSHILAYRVAGIERVGTVLDIGANVGWFTMATLLAYPNSIIHAVEPIPATYRTLQHNVGEDPRVTAWALGISNYQGAARMTFDPKRSYLSHLDPAGLIDVEVTTVDALAERVGLEEISVLKVDTEGAEHLVLDGAVETLSRTAYLFLEVTVQGNTAYTVPALLARLVTKEYDFQLVAARNFTGRSEGAVPAMDLVLANQRLVKSLGASR